MSGMHRRLPTVPIVVVDPTTRIDPESILTLKHEFT